MFVPISFTPIFEFLGYRQKCLKVESIKLGHFEEIQCGSEIRPSLDFEWSKTGWVANVSRGVFP